MQLTALKPVEIFVYFFQPMNQCVIPGSIIKGSNRRSHFSPKSRHKLSFYCWMITLCNNKPKVDHFPLLAL